MEKGRKNRKQNYITQKTIIMSIFVLHEKI